MSIIFLSPVIIDNRLTAIDKLLNRIFCVNIQIHSPINGCTMDKLAAFAISAQDRRQSASSVVADALREAIFRGVLQRGTPLRQDAIAKQFAVSQVTVREAFRLLGEEGVVDIVPRKGAVVSSLSPEDIEEIVELRITLETLLISRAIPRLTQEDYAAARAIVTQLDAALTLEDQLALNLNFHRRLYEKAERPRTLAVLDKLRLALEPYLRLLWSKSTYKANSQADHLELLALCEKKNVNDAIDVLKRHISKTADEIGTLLRAE
jgi:DNA-binding GntR family transcriptional regulator